MNVIELKGIQKNYPKFTLGKMDLEIPSGAIIGLIGENGAGKTTFIKSILNLLQLDSGTVRIFGQEVSKESKELKDDIGIVLDSMFFPEIMTPKEIGLVMQDIYSKWNMEQYQTYLERFSLPQDKALKTLSKGMRKKVELAVSLSHEAKLLILDEPTSGLDPVVREEILEIFMDFMQDEDHTILFSTHITSDLEKITDYIIFMDQGQIVLQEETQELLEHYGIVKCSKEEFQRLDKKDLLRVKKNKYSYEVLVNDRTKALKKYKGLVIDRISLEELMVLFIKGEVIK